MTETQSTAIPKPRAINKRAVFDMVCGIVALAVCVWGFWKSPVWPDRICIVAGLVPPVLLLLIRGWSRQYHPDRLPVRWSRTSRLETRLTTLGWVLTVVFVLFLFPWVFVDTSKHPVLDHACLLIAFTAQIWAQLLDHYIDDRKFIPLQIPSYLHQPASQV